MMLISDGLDVRVGNRILLEKLDFVVMPGQCWFVYGRNGVGKTTLLQTLAGLRLPDGGKLMLDGREMSSWSSLELARKRAYLSQSQQDAFGFTVFETVLAARFPWRSAKMWESQEDRNVAAHALERMDVLPLAGRDIRTLSGGERQRVAVAAMLAQDVPLLILDEPTSALDLSHQAGLMALLAKLSREENRALVTVVHDLNLAWGVATHVLLLHGDGKWEAGTCAEMMVPEKLSHCLHYPVDIVVHGTRSIFVSF